MCFDILRYPSFFLPPRPHLSHFWGLVNCRILAPNFSYLFDDGKKDKQKKSVLKVILKGAGREAAESLEGVGKSWAENARQMMKKATLAYGLPSNTLLFELRELCLTNYSNNSSVSWPALGLVGVLIIGGNCLPFNRTIHCQALFRGRTLQMDFDYYWLLIIAVHFRCCLSKHFQRKDKTFFWRIKIASISSSIFLSLFHW